MGRIAAKVSWTLLLVAITIAFAILIKIFKLIRTWLRNKKFKKDEAKHMPELEREVDVMLEEWDNWLQLYKRTVVFKAAPIFDKHDQIFHEMMSVETDESLSNKYGAIYDPTKQSKENFIGELIIQEHGIDFDPIKIAYNEQLDIIVNNRAEELFERYSGLVNENFIEELAKKIIEVTSNDSQTLFNYMISREF